jgi:hypothetical protein
MSSDFALDNYTSFLINKFLIFKINSDLHESNSILDNEILFSQITTDFINKKLNDLKYIKITQILLDNFLFFKISNTIDISQRITSEQSENIYYHYKTYKNSESKIHETETSLILDENLNTSTTFYIDSINYTSKDLVKCFDQPLYTGSKLDQWRYEYKFSLIFQQKKYIFSLYDYLDDNDNFYEFKNIYWHIASNTDKLNVHKAFINQLNLQINNSKIIEK